MSHAVLIIYILQIEHAGQHVHSWLFFTRVKIAGMATKKKSLSFYTTKILHLPYLSNIKEAELRLGFILRGMSQFLK